MRPFGGSVPDGFQHPAAVRFSERAAGRIPATCPRPRVMATLGAATHDLRCENSHNARWALPLNGIAGRVPAIYARTTPPRMALTNPDREERPQPGRPHNSRHPIFALYLGASATYSVRHVGASPSGKATDFDSVIRRFDPSRPSHSLPGIVLTSPNHLGDDFQPDAVRASGTASNPVAGFILSRSSRAIPGDRHHVSWLSRPRWKPNGRLCPSRVGRSGS